MDLTNSPERTFIMTPSYFGDNLYTLRKQKGISQDEFAESLGVSRQAVSKWERNEAYPDTENLIAIAKFFNVTIDSLINTPISVNEVVTIDADESDESKIKIDDFDDDEDDYDDDEDEEKLKRASPTAYIWNSVPFAIVATVVYLLLGFFVERGWEIGWTVFILVPVYYSVTDCIRRKSFSSFAYPVFITFIFLLFGMLYGIWHPLWIIYLTIPIYDPIASAIDRAIRK